MFSRIHIVQLAVSIGLAGAVWAQPQQPPAQSQTPPDRPTAGNPQTGAQPDMPGAIPSQVDPYAADKDFVRSVAESSATEVHLGKLAQEKGSSDAVKELGKRMVEAHTQTGQQLKQAATALNLQMPADPPRKAKKAEDKLAKLSGPEFDRTYAKMAADEQKQAVKQFEREAKNGKVPGVKDYATKNLSAEQERQKQAEDLASGATGSASRSK
jgi:putative membrane protein